MTAHSNLIEQEITRSRVYRRLADLFQYPGPDFPGCLDELETHLGRLGSNGHAPAAVMRRAFTMNHDIRQFEVDFARLFAGPFVLLAPPYGSIYLEKERRIMGDSTVDARAHYRALGFDLAAQFKEAPDHIAAELEFMHVLICREVDALSGGNRDRFADSLRRQHRFLLRHVGAWAPEFSAKVAEHARTNFYRHLACTTRRFIAEEMDAMASLPLPAAGLNPDSARLSTLPIP